MARATAAAAAVATPSSSSRPTTDRQNPTPRQRRKRHSDPFFDMSRSPSPHDAVQIAAEESSSRQLTLMQAVMTPFLMVSFLWSLFLVDHRNRRWRVAQHSQTTGPSWLPRLDVLAWMDPEPYQDSTDSAWKHGSGSQKDNGQVLTPKHSWYTHKKHRKMARLAIGDAFEMRGKVLVLFAAFWIVGLVGLIWGCKWLMN
ncbi:hypothetical protein LTR66_003621 [Elasticomyces elasticus]|nr:hypothetical protein LTR66_003621 [Elasticomyces elasticus]